MKKTKKLILLFMVGLTVLTPALGLIPPTQGRAYAAPSDDASANELIDSYIYLRAVAACLVHGDENDGKGIGEEGISQDDVNEYDWFDGEYGAPLGYLDDSGTDGEVDCNNGLNWLGDAFNLWGFENATEAICNAGFKRDGADNGQSTEDCITGGGDSSADFVYDGDEGDRIQALLKGVNAKFYGKSDSSEWPGMTGAMKYLYYSQSFLKLCGDNEVDETLYDDATIKSDKHLFLLLSPDGTRLVHFLKDVEGSDKRTTRGDTSGNQFKLSCDDMANGTQEFADDYKAEVGDEVGIDVPGGLKEIDIKCGSVASVLANPLDWISCSALAGFTTAATKMDGFIHGMLCISENDVFGGQDTCTGVSSSKSGTSESFHDAWNAFRALALGLLAIGGLVMIISQALSFEIFDAYTVKKVLPRLLIAGIGISLSWELLQFLVTFSNSLGIGVRSLIYAPFTGNGINQAILGGGESAFLSLFAVGAFGALGALGLLSFIGTALLAVLIAFFILVIRNILVILLIIIAPLAIAAYILPNTEKYYKTWWDWLLKALLVFPIITAMIALGHVFAAITTANGGAMTSFVAIAAYFAPYFLIPLAFRFAGGALGTIGGFANDRSRGMFDGLKGYRKSQRETRRKRAASNSLYDPNTKIGKRANTVAGWAADPGGNAVYAASKNRALRRIPGVAKGGAKIGSYLEHSGVEQSTKLFEELNKMGYNDKAYRLLSGAHDELSEPTRAKLRTAGLLNKRVSSLSDLNTAAGILSASESDTERIGGNAIHGSAGRLASLYQDEDMMRADIGAAGIMGLAAHGFADGKDLQVAGNSLQAEKGAGFAQSVISQSQVMGARSRPDTKAGYGVVYKDGKFIDGMSEEGGRAKALLKTLQSGDLAGAKGGAIKKLEPTIKATLDDGGGEATAVRDQLFSWAGPYSQASVDVKAQAIRIIEERAANNPDFDRDWKTYQRIEDPALRRSGPQGGGEAPGGGAGPQ